MTLKRMIAKRALKQALPLILQARTTPSHLSLALAAVCLCTATAGMAQTQNGVTGTVKESSGAGVPKASVKIVNNATQQTTTVPARTMDRMPRQDCCRAATP